MKEEILNALLCIGTIVATIIIIFVVWEITTLFLKIKEYFFNKKYPEYKKLVKEYEDRVQLSIDFHNESIYPIIQKIDDYEKEKKYLTLEEKERKEKELEELKEELSLNKKISCFLEKQIEEQRKLNANYCKEKGIKENWDQ